GMPAAHGSLWELQSMITEATGRSAVQYYAFYGCYCGLGGHGQPRDGTDWCCQRHDACYNSLLQHRCNAKKQRYRYSWHGGSPVCVKGSWCASLSCECDRSLALCLRQHLGTYRDAFRFYPRHACW
ncbi:PA2G5 phospholipase, partial [Eudromia elegans]|nr:PA2G5 phospholipase [Eudromia elegans]